MMKKSQILAAIALAMALGVVAPVVSVYADEGEEDTEGTENTDTSTTQVAQAAQKEIAELKANKFGTITTYGKNGEATEVKGEKAYEFYKENAATVNDASKFVENQKKSDGVAKTIREEVTTKIAAYKDYTDVKKITDDASVWGNANLTTTITSVGKIAEAIKSSDEYKLMDDTTRGTADKAIEDIKALVTIDAINAKIDETIKEEAEKDNSTLAKLKILYGELVKDNSVTIQSQESLNTVLTAVKKAMPQLGFYNTVSEQIAKVEGAINSGNSDDTIAAYLATLKKLVNGQITASEANEENEKAVSATAPNTGIAGTAEGTATTVSIVAGLATALTALGAGVVAYRSARRK